MVSTTATTDVLFYGLSKVVHFHNKLENDNDG